MNDITLNIFDSPEDFLGASASTSDPGKVTTPAWLAVCLQHTPTYAESPLHTDIHNPWIQVIKPVRSWHFSIKDGCRIPISPFSKMFCWCLSITEILPHSLPSVVAWFPSVCICCLVQQRCSFSNSLKVSFPCSPLCVSSFSSSP